jgi:DNA-directed RNA polymerase specialized sigma24 family protein
MPESPTGDPPLWINERDERGRHADPEVTEVAYRIWSRVLCYVRQQRGDVSEAAEILEKTVYSVSQAIHKQRDREPIRHLESYLFLSFVRRYTRGIIRQQRIQYFESAELLDSLAAGRREEWVRIPENKILVEQILGVMDPRTREMCVLRSSGYSWEAVGRQFGIKAHNAEVQFSNGLKKARDLLQGTSVPKKSGGQKE